MNPDRTETEWPAGWSSLLPRRGWAAVLPRHPGIEHWWAEGDIVSGCGQWARHLSMMIRDAPEPGDECVECQRKAQAVR